MFGVRPRTIMDWRKKGKIQAAFFLSGRPRFTIAEIEKVVSENPDIDYRPMKFRETHKSGEEKQISIGG
jgi:predicted site-specific integrase-resolvase